MADSEMGNFSSQAEPSRQRVEHSQTRRFDVILRQSVFLFKLRSYEFFREIRRKSFRPANHPAAVGRNENETQRNETLLSSILVSRGKKRDRHSFDAFRDSKFLCNVYFTFVRLLQNYYSSSGKLLRILYDNRLFKRLLA